MDNDIIKIKTKIGIINMDIKTFKALSSAFFSCSIVFSTSYILYRDYIPLLAIAGIASINGLKYQNETIKYEKELEKLQLQEKKLVLRINSK